MTKEEVMPGGAIGDDFRDLEVVDEVFVGDNAERLAALRRFCLEHGMTDRQVDASIAAARLRRSVHADMARAFKARIIENPTPTPEERSMGAFMEAIEPHVRDAVRTFRRKGYNTTTSGFSFFHYQVIGFADLREDAFDAATREQLTALGAEVLDGRIRFACEDEEAVNLDRMKERWDAIAAALPDRGRPAADSETSMAELFRKRYGGTAHRSE